MYLGKHTHDQWRMRLPQPGRLELAAQSFRSFELDAAVTQDVVNYIFDSVQVNGASLRDAFPEAAVEASDNIA